MLAMGAAMGFAMKAIFIKLAYPYGVGPVTLLALRMIFSAPVFVWVGLRARGGPGLGMRGWGVLIGVGLAGYYGSSMLDFWGLRYISAGLERLILFTYPTLTVLAGVLFFGQRWTRAMARALALTYAGIALAFLHDLRTLGDVAQVWLGAGLVLASAISFAGYLIGSAGLIVKLGSGRFTAWAMMVSTLASLGHFLATEPLSALSQPWQVYALVGAMALFSTVLPVFMQSAAIRRMGSGDAAVIGTVGPVVTIFLGWVVLGEPWSLWQVAGAGLVLAGVWQLGRRPPG
ncbi:MAG TPA: DMT family transporter [Rhodocyclaceae bacterium]|nr:DMT family transporter [Rhodocyclaceae bacterium]